MKFPVRLMTEEWNTLNRLARVSKMDCWFVLRSNDNHDWCYDAENSVAISLHSAIKVMDEGLTDYDLSALTAEQQLCYRGCLRRFGLAG